MTAFKGQNTLQLTIKNTYQTDVFSFHLLIKIKINYGMDIWLDKWFQGEMYPFSNRAIDKITMIQIKIQ